MSYSIHDQVLKDRARLGTMRFPNEAEALQICCAITGALHKIYPNHMWEMLSKRASRPSIFERIKSFS